jgi:hypothetical protein
MPRCRSLDLPVRRRALREAARGVAWCAVKPDGNRRVKGGVAQSGFVLWDMKDKTDAERKQILGTAVRGLAEKARELGVAVAIENLDFATKKIDEARRRREQALQRDAELEERLSAREH